ncbi:MAG: hypothetical protein RLZZ524_600 [Pseudomonadota bacterium]
MTATGIKIYHPTIPQRSNWGVAFQLVKPNTDPAEVWDLTGFTLEAEIRNAFDGSVLATMLVEVVDAANGNIAVGLTRAQSEALTAQCAGRVGRIGVWDLLIHHSGTTSRLIEGDVFLSQGVTRPTAADGATGVVVTEPAVVVVGPVSGSGTAAGVAYAHPDHPDVATVKDALDELFYVAPSISSFSASPSQVEVGDAATPALAWTLAGGAITSQAINQGVAALALADRAAVAAAEIDSDTTWTLTVSDGTTTATRQASTSFRLRRYWGVSGAVPDLADLSSELAAGRTQTRTMDGGGLYLCFAWPSSWGTPTFTVGGFAVTFQQTTQTVTNAFGHAESYDIWRSEYPQNGTGLSVVVT